MGAVNISSKTHRNRPSSVSKWYRSPSLLFPLCLYLIHKITLHKLKVSGSLNDVIFFNAYDFNIWCMDTNCWYFPKCFGFPGLWKRFYRNVRFKANTLFKAIQPETSENSYCILLCWNCRLNLSHTCITLGSAFNLTWFWTFKVFYHRHYFYCLWMNVVYEWMFLPCAVFALNYLYSFLGQFEMSLNDEPEIFVLNEMANKQKSAVSYSSCSHHTVHHIKSSFLVLLRSLKWWPKAEWVLIAQMFSLTLGNYAGSFGVSCFCVIERCRGALSEKMDGTGLYALFHYLSHKANHPRESRRHGGHCHIPGCLQGMYSCSYQQSLNYQSVSTFGPKTPWAWWEADCTMRQSTILTHLWWVLRFPQLSICVFFVS